MGFAIFSIIIDVLLLVACFYVAVRTSKGDNDDK